MKYKYILSIFVAVSLFTMFTSCNKDEERETTEVKDVFVPEILSLTKGSVTGFVYDDNGNPIEGARVVTYNAETRTNRHGIFEFINIDMDHHGSYFRVVKDGYISGSDKVFPTAGRGYSSVQLIQLKTSKSFNSADGGTVPIDKGGNITFAKNSIATDQGDNYEGTVFVTAEFLSPTRDNLSDVMPGDLVGDAKENRTVVLGTAGMIAVELRGDNGQLLNIKEGSSATITVPYIDSSFPDEIKLWSYDEEAGRWKEEGVAKRQGDNYVAQVPHFSFWNCDVSYPLINLCGKVVNESGDPVITKVEISVDGIGTGYGYTDDMGNFCGKVPKGGNLTITAVGIFCRNKSVSVQKGPYMDDVVIDPIIVEDLFPNIVGEVVCMNEPYENTTIFMKANSRTYVISPRNKSSFDININTLCDNPSTIVLQAIDNETNEVSPQENIAPGSNQFYTLELCASPCDFSGNISIDCNDNDLRILIQDSTGVGNFEYQWSNGSDQSTITISSQEPQIYCVTVTETGQGCTKEFCKEAVAGPFTANSFVEPCEGYVDIRLRGGIPPFTIKRWDGKEYEEDRVSFSIFDAPDGQNVCIEIVDARGCMIESCFTIVYEEPPFLNPNPRDCEENLYFFDSDPVTFAVGYDNLGNQYQIDDLNPITLDVITGGLSVKTIEIVSWNGCFAQYDVNMPFFEGLEDVVANNTTCQGCEDGSLQVIFNPDANCNRCEFGGIKVFTENKLDVTDLNNAENLVAGTYYVVGVDSTNGCWVAFREMTIE